MDILKVENVNYGYFGSIPALVDINLSIGEGERFAIIGSNGSGKSTLLHIMNGLLPPVSGRLFFKGEEVNERRLRERAFLRFFRQGVGFVFQYSDIQLFCPTVRDELLFGPLQLGLGQEEAEDRARAVMEMLGVGRLSERATHMLSGGEKKLVALGSVLTMNPEVLLLDEPGNGLDPRTQCFLLELTLALSEAGKTIVIATHDLSLVSELECRVAVLSESHTIAGIGEAEGILYDTELLLAANLIHEHRHFHGSLAHRHPHSHYLFHRHETAEGQA